MKILLLTIGSRGDVQPFVALGQGLKAAGHDVTVATCARFQGFIEAHGLAYGFISDDLLKIVDSDQGKALMEDTRGILKIVMANIRLARQISPIQQRAVDQSWDVAQEVMPDLVCFHPKALLGPAIAEKLQIPGIMASPLPFLVPTGEYPCMGFPVLPLGGVVQSAHIQNCPRDDQGLCRKICSHLATSDEHAGTAHQSRAAA